MKHRHTIMLLCVSLVVCVILRVLQIAFTIDSATGFVKQQYSAISLAITIIVCAATAAVAFLAAYANETIQKKEVFHPAVASAAIFAGVMFMYKTIINITLLGKGAWYTIFLVLLTLLSALAFAAYGARELFDFNIPSIILVVPVVYYIVELISVFVSTASLALVTENVFLIFTNCVLLWFMYEFASFENSMGDSDKSPKKLFASGLAVVMMCAVTALPKIILIISGRLRASYEDIATALLNIAIGVFVLVYILCNFVDKTTSEKPTYKHSA